MKSSYAISHILSYKLARSLSGDRRDRPDAAIFEKRNAEALQGEAKSLGFLLARRAVAPLKRDKARGGDLRCGGKLSLTDAGISPGGAKL
jgi:hypothetical protein